MENIVFLFLATIFLAYSNGANDNFKGVATLYGSNTASYRTAIALASVAVFAGALGSLFLSQGLIQNFSGKGLVPDTVANSSGFLLSAALGAGVTVMLASWLGFPISTTHSLTGALAGAGFMAAGPQINLSILGKVFMMPLIVFPVISVVLAALTHMSFRSVRQKMGVTKEWCVCLGPQQHSIPVPEIGSGHMARSIQFPEIMVAETEKCQLRYCGRILGINIQSLVDLLHFISAGMVSFARGLNDTPKIAALMLSAKALGITRGTLWVGLAMVMGGLLNARKVAETMGKRITELHQGQGFSANLVTGLIVAGASWWGLPVSTTHVSCGSIIGIGLLSKKANVRLVGEIMLAWILTLPLAALLSAGFYGMLKLF